MRIYIKNMVCNRCINAVKQLLTDLKLQYRSVQLGEVEFTDEPSSKQLLYLKERLELLGFELLDDAKTQLIDKIKTTIIEFVHYGIGDETHNFSELLTSKVHMDYSYLSNLFSSTEGITIEKYLIHQKIERAKELIVYKELNLNEIAFQLGYSSAAHLSAQFKKITGFTPTHFKSIGGVYRKTIDKV